MAEQESPYERGRRRARQYLAGPGYRHEGRPVFDGGAPGREDSEEEGD